MDLSEYLGIDNIKNLFSWLKKTLMSLSGPTPPANN